MRQENRLLGKRAEPVEPLEALEIQEAANREIIRRRHHSDQSSLPITLKERRANDKANISKCLKEFNPLLTSWTQIVDYSLNGQKAKMLIKIPEVDDFIDGFLINAPDYVSARWL